MGMTADSGEENDFVLCKPKKERKKTAMNRSESVVRFADS
jgi:hypothetical protein